VAVFDIMADHEELVAEMPSVERMPIAERLKLAKKRRLAQLKACAQFEKQSSKDRDHKTKKSTSEPTTIAPRKTARLRFANNILLLDAAGKNDLVEGTAIDLLGKFILYTCVLISKADFVWKHLE